MSILWRLQNTTRASYGRLAKRFLRDETGATMMTFGLSIIPLTLAIGIAVDYSKASRARINLQTAVDAAALKVAQNSTLSSAALTTLAQATIASNLGVPVSAVPTPTVTAQGSGAYQVKASTTTPTNFMALGGWSSLPIGASATATTSAGSSTPGSTNATTYVNLHVVVDNSQSMGVGANTTDQVNMSKSSIGCSFACHSSVVQYKTTTDACRGPSQSLFSVAVDSVHLARHSKPVYLLRIDAVLNSLKSFLASAATQAQQKNVTLNVALYTLNNGLQQVQQLTSSVSQLSEQLTNGDNIANSANPPVVIDLATDDAGTSIPTALSTLATYIGNTGDGSSSAKPLSYVLLISDGVYDNADNLGTNYNASGAQAQGYDGQDNNWGGDNNYWGQQYGWNQQGGGQNQGGWGNWGNQGGGWGQNGDNSNVWWANCGNNCGLSGKQSFNGNLGNHDNDDNKYQFGIDGNGRLLTGSQQNSDHWSVAPALTGNLCYPGATGATPIGTSPYNAPTGQYFSGAPSAPPCIPDPQYGGNFEIGPIQPAWCTPVTSTGATMITLYTTYVMEGVNSSGTGFQLTASNAANPPDSQYYDRRAYYIATYQNAQSQGFLQIVQQNMQSCASSSSWSYQATSSSDITTAMTSILTNTVTPTSSGNTVAPHLIQ
jgi:Flp pilus assembly protein TadG